jgi:NTP pyrophosphatase (non-canonical NTP hydrolase)
MTWLDKKNEVISLDTLTGQIDKWGYDKGILPNPKPKKQFDKTMEEVGELQDAIITNDREEVKDAIGDIVVTLIMQTHAWDLTLVECVEQAYNVISKRTGKMVDGIFVKD